MPNKNLIQTPDIIDSKFGPFQADLRIEHLFGDDRPFAQCHAATLGALDGEDSTLVA